jgi:hypothetical protein
LAGADPGETTTPHTPSPPPKLSAPAGAPPRPDDAALFRAYLELGADRTYQAVADRFGVPLGWVQARAKRRGWQARLEAMEERAHERAVRATAESLAQIDARHLKSLRRIQERAVRYCREAAPPKTFREAASALAESIRLERVILGEPADRTAATIEATIKRETERWARRAPAPEGETGEGPS